MQAQLRQRAEQEGGPVSASAFVRFSHDLATRETETRVSLPKRDAASRATAMSAAGGGSASGELNPKYQRHTTGCGPSSSSPVRTSDAGADADVTT